MTGRAVTRHKHPFISRVRLRHFKSVAEGDVGLAPLTLVVGENSSGKSAMLHALYLLSRAVGDTSFVDNIEETLLVPSEKLLNVRAQPSEYISVGADVTFPDIDEGNADWSWNPGSLDEGQSCDGNRLGPTFLDDRIHYIGPLRNPSESVQGSELEPLRDEVGRRGEKTANLLARRGPDTTGLPMPGDGAPTNEDVLRSWAIDLGLVEELRTVDHRSSSLASIIVSAWTGITPIEIEVRPHGLNTFLPLSSVGVGVGQVLPVLVQCLLAEPGSAILLEQPELHLHPASQQRLADFFIAMVRSGRQLIVETHSEYMVSRLRRRIVEDPDDELLELSKVIFAERDSETGFTTYREVELSPLGAIEEWPAGFFDQAAEEERAIILSGVKKLRERAVDRQ